MSKTPYQDPSIQNPKTGIEHPSPNNGYPSIEHLILLLKLFNSDYLSSELGLTISHKLLDIEHHDNVEVISKLIKV